LDKDQPRRLSQRRKVTKSMAMRAVQSWTSEGVSARAQEGLHLEVLLEGLEEELHLPAFAVDGADGVGGELHVVGDQRELALVLLVPHDHTPQGVGAMLARPSLVSWISSSRSR